MHVSAPVSVLLAGPTELGKQAEPMTALYNSRDNSLDLRVLRKTH